MESTQNHPAKYAFLYLLSLVGLIFMALSSGIIIFQIINKFIFDALDTYSGTYDSGALKFAISAIIISAPIFYLTMRVIHRSLFDGRLSADSGIRKWLTYFIMLVSSIVMLVWLVITINGFLNGELSTKFLLKALTAIGISAAIFGFYYYDIMREKVKGEKDKMICVFFYASLAFVLVTFIASLFVVESPTQTRYRKHDEAILNDFQSIGNAVEQYYNEKDMMPEKLDILKQEFAYISDTDLSDPNGNAYAYRATGDLSYELCANFLTTNLNVNDTIRNYYLDEQWPHDSGDQCIKQEIRLTDTGKPMPRSIPVQ